MSRVTMAQKEAAMAVLRGRAEMPADVAAWGRQWGMTPGEATVLVTKVQREKSKTG